FGGVWGGPRVAAPLGGAVAPVAPLPLFGARGAPRGEGGVGDGHRGWAWPRSLVQSGLQVGPEPQEVLGWQREQELLPSPQSGGLDEESALPREPGQKESEPPATR
ncbi:MAG: hypothetical protein Q6L58_10195, partial [Thermostichales cyanobacterium BF3_bins_165]